MTIVCLCRKNSHSTAVSALEFRATNSNIASELEDCGKLIALPLSLGTLKLN